MDGYEMTRRLRLRTLHQRVILAALTGWGKQEDCRRSAGAGFDYRLVKTVSPEELEVLILNLAGS